MTNDETDTPINLLGPTVDARYYDDELALTEYVWRHFRQFVTPFELRVGMYAVPIVSDIDSEKGRRIYDHCESKHGHVEDEAVRAAFPGDLASFRLETRRRLMREPAEEVFVNRCRKCSRIVRTPTARPCPWCKHRWYDT
ncbi:MAG: hypothetical protein H8E66_00705 [Planctomycetes bacterium]|nr:hypothetical protein [Planctomycetota bacterium]